MKLSAITWLNYWKRCVINKYCILKNDYAKFSDWHTKSATSTICTNKPQTTTSKKTHLYLYTYKYKK